MNRSSVEIDNKHIDIHMGANKLLVPSDSVDGEVRVGVPDMDSHEGDRDTGDKQRNSKKPSLPKKRDKEDGKNLGLFEKSPSSTFKDLQRKLDQVRSPSDSKVSDSAS